MPEGVEETKESSAAVVSQVEAVPQEHHAMEQSTVEEVQETPEAVEEMRESSVAAVPQVEAVPQEHHVVERISPEQLMRIPSFRKMVISRLIKKLQ